MKDRKSRRPKLPPAEARAAALAKHARAAEIARLARNANVRRVADARRA